jgi:Tfp pilus assembly protein PilN
MGSIGKDEKTKAELKEELAALRAQVAELEALEAERRRAEQVQDALYRIAGTASAAQDMPESTLRSIRRRAYGTRTNSVAAAGAVPLSARRPA